MKHFSVLGTCIAATSGLSLHAHSAYGQQPSLKEGLVGTWMVISWEQKKNDGTTLRQFGENPTGMAIFDAGGQYIITVMRSDRAKYTSDALWQGTSEENKATANGTQTYFGTYVVNEAVSQFMLKVVPFRIGMARIRSVSLQSRETNSP
jgi:hypothetical protein